MAEKNKKHRSTHALSQTEIDKFMETYASRLEQEVAQEKQAYRLMADAMPQIVWTSTPDGYTDYYSKKWYEFSGLTEKESLGYQAGILAIMHPDDVKQTNMLWEKALQSGQPYQVEYRLKDRKTNQYRWFLGQALPGRDASGKIIRWIGTYTDVDDIRRNAKRTRELVEVTSKLRKQRAQLVALNRAKDEFISLASHQLRTPATGVKQYIGMMLQGYAGRLTSNQKAMLQMAYDSNERQITIVNDLLKVAHIDAGKVSLVRSRVDLVSLLADVIREQHGKFKSRQQTVNYLHPGKKTYVNIDVDKMRMVLENIIDNASKYTPDNKNISIELTVRAESTKIRIADQGVGIAKGDIKYLFQKFSRVHNPLSQTVGGTGLGLYWAKKVVDLHGGAIEIESKLKQGSAFIISVPTLDITSGHSKSSKKATQRAEVS